LDIGVGFLNSIFFQILLAVSLKFAGTEKV